MAIICRRPWSFLLVFGNGKNIEKNTMKKICPHRGFQFDGTTCPYHGLSYPPKKECFVEPGKIFGYLDGSEVEEFDESLGENFFSIKQRVQAPFYLWMQNVSDPNHLKNVHPDFEKNFDGDPFDVRFSDDSKISSYQIRVRQNIAEKYSKLVGNEVSPFFFHMTLFPYVSCTSFLNVFMSVEDVEPVGKGACEVDTRFFVRKGIKVPVTLKRLAANANRKILMEDREIVERWATTAKITGNWLPGEDRIRVYCDLLTKHGLIPQGR